MRQPLSSLTRWVVSNVLAGLETGPIADPLVGRFLDVDGTFITIDVPAARRTHAFAINDAWTTLVAYVPAVVPQAGALSLFSVGLLEIGLDWRRRGEVR